MYLSKLLIAYSSIAACPDNSNMSSLSREDRFVFRTFSEHPGELCLAQRNLVLKKEFQLQMESRLKKKDTIYVVL